METKNLVYSHLRDQKKRKVMMPMCMPKRLSVGLCWCTLRCLIRRFYPVGFGLGLLSRPNSKRMIQCYQRANIPHNKRHGFLLWIFYNNHCPVSFENDGAIKISSRPFFLSDLLRKTIVLKDISQFVCCGFPDFTLAPSNTRVQWCVGWWWRAPKSQDMNCN